ncbi:MAG: hypothetical protein PHI24_09170 [Desulfitobacteriaceae bacterium]|nr:hypothetical protein [Desulfitobacteriaceae bacterium]
MSFRCGTCNKPQGSGAKPIKVITEIRRVTYPPTRNGKIPDGFEIVREVDMCKKCADRHN